MPRSVRLPVVGIFYSEMNHFDEWLSSVESQRSSDIEPIPVIVVSKHPDYVQQFQSITDTYIRDGRLQREHVHICDDNVGHTRGFRIGAERFVREPNAWRWIASLDPDARFAPEALRHLHHVAEQATRVGMVSPLVIEPRPDRDFRRAVDARDRVCHAGHFPRVPTHISKPKSRPGLINFWQSHFMGWTVDQVLIYFRDHPQCAPFSACFCSALWSSHMFSEIGMPDERQFRTLNCGEIGYRAQLNRWSGRFASNAFAFHPNPPNDAYASALALKEPNSTAGHFYHAQGLIALRYFPDHLRNIAERQGNMQIPWERHYHDLKEITPDTDDVARRVVFDNWSAFDFKR